MQSLTPSPIQTVQACPASHGVVRQAEHCAPWQALLFAWLASRMEHRRLILCRRLEHAVHRQQPACCLRVGSTARLVHTLSTELPDGVRACYEKLKHARRRSAGKVRQGAGAAAGGCEGAGRGARGARHRGAGARAGAHRGRAGRAADRARGAGGRTRAAHPLPAPPGGAPGPWCKPAASAPSCTLPLCLQGVLRKRLRALQPLRASARRPVRRSRQEEVAEERAAADDARAAHSRARLAAYGLGLTTALSVITVGIVTARCLRQRA